MNCCGYREMNTHVHETSIHDNHEQRSCRGAGTFNRMEQNSSPKDGHIEATVVVSMNCDAKMNMRVKMTTGGTAVSEKCMRLAASLSARPISSSLRRRPQRRYSACTDNVRPNEYQPETESARLFLLVALERTQHSDRPSSRNHNLGQADTVFAAFNILR
ncbi:hypothetical protein BLNAU_4055 [Blattamonas nauphoetae]|uniref:Uncharacterized protein n=1 Tax=Blattamonas nauphoetae TaxID=2049346 RepID=A0ABQ9YBB4_9EUKA|nr:hypothetical protein BLNAU_4055 [Blattamonas nauphoetae]